MQIFRLIIKKQHYYLLIYRKTIMFARKFLRYLRSNGKNHIINNYVKGNENERLFTFLFF